MFACLYRPPAASGQPRQATDGAGAGDPATAPIARDLHGASTCEALARDFSPRYECHHDGLVSMDISGLGRLFRASREGGAGSQPAGRPDLRAIGEALRREAAARGMRIHVAIAGTRTAALILAYARPGLTIIAPGQETEALAPLPISSLVAIGDCFRGRSATSEGGPARLAGALEIPEITAFRTWGLKTVGELAALPSPELAARLGERGLFWQALARGEDLRPLVPSVPEERFDASLDLEWPIEGLEPLSFVLTRLLEPIATRLERRDRAAAVLHVELRLVSRDIHVRSLQLPSPIRDVRTLRTLALLDLESHPPAAGIDRVTVRIDPTPGRVLQHTLFTRPHPTPEQLSTLLARLGALMGQDRIGAAALVDTERPGAFAMRPFAPESRVPNPESQVPNPESRIPSVLRRCRQPVPARVVADVGRPVRVMSDRRGFAGGAVVRAVGPWRTSGDWWVASGWNRDEWDVALHDGVAYRMFHDRDIDRWFIDAVID